MNSPPWYPGANAGVSFGTPNNFPLNPVRGHFFWDGVTLWMFDGAAWVISGGSSMVATTPPTSTAPSNPVPGQQWFSGTQLYVWDGVKWIAVSQTKTYIQATAPPSPNPGDLWFDNTQLHIWSGTAWLLVGPGATVGPVPTSTISLNVSNSAGYVAAAANTWVQLPITGTPIIDTMNAWSTSTMKYTPTKAGVYYLSSSVWSAGGSVSLIIAKNDPGSIANQAVSVIAANEVSIANSWCNAIGVANMNGSTDFVRVWVNSTLSPNNVWAQPAPPAFEAVVLP